VPLSPRGIWQANRLAERLASERVAGERIDAVIASDLARAWLTGETLARCLDRAVDNCRRLRAGEELADRVA
jgi:probable phosphoglycerate mutase